MKRTVTIHAMLLLAALIAAYLVWTRDRTSTKDDERPVLALRQVDRVIYEAPGERKVEVKRKKDAHGPYYWVSVEKWERQRPPRGARPPQNMRRGMKRGMRRGMNRGMNRGMGRPPMGRPMMPRPPAKGAKIAKPVFKAAPNKAAPNKAAPNKAAPKVKTPAGAEKSLRRDPKADPAKAAPNKAAPKKAAPQKVPAKKLIPVKVAPGPKIAAPTPAKGALPAKVAPIKRPPPKPLPKVRKESHFVGNKATEDLMKTLAKLPAIRSLGQLGKVKLEEFGLAKSKKKLTIIAGKNERAFKVGKRTHGNMDYYLQDLSDQRVYVIRPRAMQDLSYAEYRLMERNLHTFDSTDFDGVRISAAKDKKVALRQHNRRKPSKATYSRVGGEGKAEPRFKAWMLRLGRLRALEYPKDLAALKGLSPVARVEYFAGKKALGATELLVLQKSISGPADYYARSETSRVPVKVGKSIVKELEKDLPALFVE